MYEALGRVPYSQCTSLPYSQTHPNPLGGHNQPVPQPSSTTRTARQTKFHHLLSDLWDTCFDAQYGQADQIEVGEVLSNMIKFLIETTATEGSLKTVATRPSDQRLLWRVGSVIRDCYPDDENLLGTLEAAVFPRKEKGIDEGGGPEGRMIRGSFLSHEESLQITTRQP
jgi:hypothetical protein